MGHRMSWSPGSYIGDKIRCRRRGDCWHVRARPLTAATAGKLRVIAHIHEAFVEGTRWRHKWFVKLLSPCRIIPLVTIVERRSLCLMWCMSRT